MATKWTLLQSYLNNPPSSKTGYIFGREDDFCQSFMRLIEQEIMYDRNDDGDRVRNEQDKPQRMLVQRGKTRKETERERQRITHEQGREDRNVSSQRGTMRRPMAVQSGPQTIEPLPCIVLCV